MTILYSFELDLSIIIFNLSKWLLKANKVSDEDIRFFLERVGN